MANIDNPNGFKLISSGTQGPQIVSRALAATQTIAKGDAVIDDTNGLVAIAVATSPLLLGVSVAGGTTASLTNLKFAPGVPWNVFEGQCSGTYTATMRFSAVDIEGTTGIMEVNENATTEDVIQIVGENPDQDTPVGLNSRVYFIILRSYWYPVLAAK
jgi:hypothetical protein